MLNASMIKQLVDKQIQQKKIGISNTSLWQMPIEKSYMPMQFADIYLPEKSKRFTLENISLTYVFSDNIVMY